jgi:uncharacterized protein (TIGR02118 family)
MAQRRSESKKNELSPKSRSRRKLIVGAGKAIAAGAVASALGAVVAAQTHAPTQGAGSQPMRCMTVLYKNGDDVKFDFEYYKTHHLTMIMKLYGNSIHRFELRKGLAAQDGAKPPYVAVVNIWIADEKAFEDNNAKYGAQLVADVPHFTNTTPVIQKDETYAVATS